MKRLIILFIILSLIVGCSNKVSNNETSDDLSQENESVLEGNEEEETENEDDEELKDVKDNTGGFNMRSLENDIVANIISKSLYPGIGEEIEIKFRVKNKGKYNVDKFDYKIVISKNENIIYEFKNITNSSIKIDESITIKELYYKFESLGTYKVELILDELNTVKELEELNNINSIKIFVKEQSTKSSSDDEEEDKDDSQGCSDSDGGKDYDELGTCKDSNFKSGKKDFCASDYLLAEMYCSATGDCDIEMESCEGICRDGVCI
ncbi:hypothetical protein KY321_05035 [Candidatus Woesearchaeota archaeon]|nr:hypothetical protein [Candidatus Woesearchaeota archaeon]